MADTILGAIIGAVSAIVSGVVTAIITYKLTIMADEVKWLREQKALRDKREQEEKDRATLEQKRVRDILLGRSLIESASRACDSAHIEMQHFLQMPRLVRSNDEPGHPKIHAYEIAFSQAEARIGVIQRQLESGHSSLAIALDLLARATDMPTDDVARLDNESPDQQASPCPGR